jgi:hypothetical protein
MRVDHPRPGTLQITQSRKRAARFGDVARIQIRTIRHANGDSEQRLPIVLKSDEKLRIDQSSNTQEIADIADDLAEVLGVEITRKG